MRKFETVINNVKYVRTNKRGARSTYNKGQMVIITPCNMRPEYGGIFDKYIDEGRVFDSIVNEYEFYNCRCGVGEYPAYYIPVEVYKNGETLKLK